MPNLDQMKCVPCKKGMLTLSDAAIAEYIRQVPGWVATEVEGVKRIEKAFKFKDFREALAFTVSVGEVAEEEDHHPSIVTDWGKVKVTWWTHVIKGLHKNDFIMAAKTDSIFAMTKKPKPRQQETVKSPIERRVA